MYVYSTPLYYSVTVWRTQSPRIRFRTALSQQKRLKPRFMNDRRTLLLHFNKHRSFSDRYKQCAIFQLQYFRVKLPWSLYLKFMRSLVVLLFVNAEKKTEVASQIKYFGFYMYTYTICGVKLIWQTIIYL